MYHGLAHPPQAHAPMEEEDWPEEMYDQPQAPPQPPQPGPQPPQQGPQRPGYQPPPSLNRPDLGPGPRRPQTYDIDMDPPDPPDLPDQPMGPAPSMQSFGRPPPDAPGGRSRVPRETQSGPNGSMNPDVQIISGGEPPPPGAGAVAQPVKPKKGRDGPYQRPSDDLGPPADGIMNLPFPTGPSNPTPILPVTPTPKAIVRRNRPGPYEQPAEEEESLGPPADGIMNLPFPLGPQPTPIEEDRTMRSDFAPKRPSETPLAATTAKKPASGPPSWPPPPTRSIDDESLVPQDGVLTVQYPTASSSSSSSSGGPPPSGPAPPQKPKKKPPPPAPATVAEEEEALVPLDGVMTLPYSRRLRQVNLSLGNQKVW